MTIGESFLPEFDQEMANTRTMLERVPEDRLAWKPAEPLASREELLNLFDSKRSEAREAIAGASDESLMRTWSVKVGEKTIFSMPRAAVVRSLVLNQIIHHRGQFSVYPLLHNIPVPGMYGPSAGESN